MGFVDSLTHTTVCVIYKEADSQNDVGNRDQKKFFQNVALADLFVDVCIRNMSLFLHLWLF